MYHEGSDPDIREHALAERADHQYVVSEGANGHFVDLPQGTYVEQVVRGGKR